VSSTPKQLDDLRVALADLLEEARTYFTEPSKKLMTIVVREPGQPERDCIVTDDTPQGIQEAVLRRFPELQAALAAERARREKAEEVVDILLDAGPTDSYDIAKLYRAQYPRVEQAKP